MDRQQISFILNGRSVDVWTEPSRSLLKVLREQFELTGTKQGCGQGECGTCTVLLMGKAVTSCLVPIGKVEGKTVLTIEGLSAEEMHPIQKAFVEHGAIQCGYCTPGMVLSVKALLDICSKPTEDQIREALSGNLCRCTGYIKIIKAVTSLTEGKP